MNIKEKYVKADKLIKDFQTMFKTEFGVIPLISYNLESSKKIPILGLPELESLINDVFQEHYPAAYVPDGIRSRSRNLTVVMFRFIYFKTARDMAYGLKMIGNYIGFDHATVLHANKTISNLLDVQDSVVVKYYNIIKNEIQARTSYHGDVQVTEPAENHA